MSQPSPEPPVLPTYPITDLVTSESLNALAGPPDCVVLSRRDPMTGQVRLVHAHERDTMEGCPLADFADVLGTLFPPAPEPDPEPLPETDLEPDPDADLPE